MGKTEEDATVPDYGFVRKEWIERQNLQLRSVPQIITPDLSGTPEYRRRRNLDVGASSMSTLTGLSLGSRMLRPCQAVRTLSTGRGSSCRSSPALLLNHGYEWISAEDQRILTIMAMRREAKIEEEEVLLAAMALWEKDRITYNQMMNEKKREWKEYVEEKRREEKLQLEQKKEHREHELLKQQEELQNKIQLRHTHCQLRQSQLQLCKKVSSDDIDTWNYRIRREKNEKDKRAVRAQHESQVLSKQQRAMDNLNVILSHRDRSIQERRCQRERKMEAAQQLRESLHRRWEEWCEDYVRFLTNKLYLSQHRAAKLVDWRRKATRDKNVMKMLHHSRAISILREEERVREEEARQAVKNKDARIRSVLEQKEVVKQRSRNNALTTAGLRQQIKASYQLNM